MLDLGKKIPKKIAKKFKKLKTSFRHYFLPKRDEIGRESEKKILVPNFVHTRPWHENSKNKSEKNSKPLSGIFFFFLPKRDQIGREIEKI